MSIVCNLWPNPLATSIIFSYCNNDHVFHDFIFISKSCRDFLKVDIVCSEVTAHKNAISKVAASTPKAQLAAKLADAKKKQDCESQDAETQSQTEEA